MRNMHTYAHTYTVTHSHTQSHTVTQFRTPSHTLTAPHPPHPPFSHFLKLHSAVMQALVHST